MTEIPLTWQLPMLQNAVCSLVTCLEMVVLSSRRQACSLRGGEAGAVLTMLVAIGQAGCLLLLGPVLYSVIQNPAGANDHISFVVDLPDIACNRSVRLPSATSVAGYPAFRARCPDPAAYDYKVR